MSCNVVNGNCLAPPGLAGLGVPCRTVCWACGLPVCRECSRKRDWHRWTNKRICDNCHEEDLRLQDRRGKNINAIVTLLAAHCEADILAAVEKLRRRRGGRTS